MTDIIWYDYKFPNYFKDNEDGYEVRVINKKTHETIFIKVLTEKEYQEVKDIIKSDTMALLNVLNEKYKDVAQLKIKKFHRKDIPNIHDPNLFIKSDSYFLP